jgi:hypothetical protein
MNATTEIGKSSTHNDSKIIAMYERLGTSIAKITTRHIHKCTDGTT